MSLFGKITEGQTALNNGWANSLFLCRYQAPEDGHISRISFLSWYGNPGFFGKGVIFSYDPVNNRPLALLAEGSERELLSWTLLQSDISYDMRAGEQLYIGFYMQRNTWGRGDPGLLAQTVIWYQNGVIYPVVPTTFALNTEYITYDSEASIYATYTPSTVNGLLEVHTFIGQTEYTSTIKVAGTFYDVPTANPITLPPGEYTVLWDFYGISQQAIVVAGQTTVVNLIYTPPPIKYRLNASSAPSEVTFTIRGINMSYQTPDSILLDEGTYEIEFPPTITVDEDTLYPTWEDGSTNPTRTVLLNADRSVFATYSPVAPPTPPPGWVRFIRSLGPFFIGGIGLIISRPKKRQ